MAFGEKRWRPTALQDAGAKPMWPEIREASWSAPVLWRFRRRKNARPISSPTKYPNRREEIYPVFWAKILGDATRLLSPSHSLTESAQIGSLLQCIGKFSQF